MSPNMRNISEYAATVPLNCPNVACRDKGKSGAVAPDRVGTFEPKRQVLQNLDYLAQLMGNPSPFKTNREVFGSNSFVRPLYP